MQSVLRALAPLPAFCQVFGTCPFYVKGSGTPALISKTYNAALIIVVSCIGGFALIPLTLQFYEAMASQNSAVATMRFSQILITVSGVASATTILHYVLAKDKPLIAIVTTLQSICRQLSARDDLYATIHRHALLYVVLIFTFACHQLQQAAFWEAFMFDVFGMRQLHFNAVLVQRWLQFLIEMQFALLIRTAAQILNFINQDIHLMAHGSRARVAERLWQLRRAHRSVCEQINELGHAYETCLLLDVAMLFVDMLSGLYIACTSGSVFPQHSGGYARLEAIFWSVTAYARLTHLGVLLHNAKRTVHATNAALVKLGFSVHNDRAARDELWLFQDWLRHANVDVTLLGLFSVDLNLVLAITGSEITYLAIFLHFHFLRNN